jgi:cytochrome c5
LADINLGDNPVSASQNETFSPHNIAVLIGLLLLALILGEGVFPNKGNETMVDTMGSVEDIVKRLKPVVMLDEMRANMPAAPVDTSSMTVEQLYDGACLACHTAGVAGAPKLGNAEDWAPRLAKGLDALTATAINGIGIMAPRGGSQYDDDQIRSIINYMTGQTADVTEATSESMSSASTEATSESVASASTETTSESVSSTSATSTDNADAKLEQMYNASCMACHASGVAGAPKVGRAEDWAPRIAKGIDALTKSAIKGIGIMAPRGGSQFSDDQIRDIINYMMAQSNN